MCRRLQPSKLAGERNVATFQISVWFAHCRKRMCSLCRYKSFILRPQIHNIMKNSILLHHLCQMIYINTVDLQGLCKVLD